jgi:hypothetical protein
MIGVSLIVSSLVKRMCKGNRVRVQPKTVVRISHHCGFAGTSQTTIPGLSQSHRQFPRLTAQILCEKWPKCQLGFHTSTFPDETKIQPMTSCPDRSPSGNQKRFGAILFTRAGAERSGLLTCTVTESASLCVRMKS